MPRKPATNGSNALHFAVACACLWGDRQHMGTDAISADPEMGED